MLLSTFEHMFAIGPEYMAIRINRFRYVQSVSEQEGCLFCDKLKNMF